LIGSERKLLGKRMPFFRTGIAVAAPSVVSIQSHQDSHSMTSRRAKQDGVGAQA
jgi:hypothetical protein